MLTSPSGEVLPSDVLSRPRLVDPEVAAHAERVLALVRGLADARRARATKLTALPSELLSLVLAQLCLVSDIKGVKSVCKAFRDAAGPAEQAHRRVCFEHAGKVNCVAAAPDGRVITGSNDKRKRRRRPLDYSSSVKVWRDGVCERTIRAHNDVTAVAVLPDGARFVSGSSDGYVKLWTLDGKEEDSDEEEEEEWDDDDDDELERTFDIHSMTPWRHASGSSALYVAALPDGVHFVVGLGYAYGMTGSYGEVRLYHVDGTLVHAFEGDTGMVYAVAVTPDGQHIISGAHDGILKVWSVASKSLVSNCIGHTEGVLAVAAMPDGQRLLSGDGDGDVRVWLLNGTLENTFELHTGYYGRVRALVALPDNQHALSGSDDETVKLFNVNDGTVLRSFEHHEDTVNCLALMPDGLRFVSGSDDNTTRIVEIW